MHGTVSCVLRGLSVASIPPVQVCTSSCSPTSCCQPLDPHGILRGRAFQQQFSWLRPIVMGFQSNVTQNIRLFCYCYWWRRRSVEIVRLPCDVGTWDWPWHHLQTLIIWSLQEELPPKNIGYITCLKNMSAHSDSNRIGVSYSSSYCWNFTLRQFWLLPFGGKGGSQKIKMEI